MTVTFRAPLRVPGVTRLLAPRGRPPYEFPVRATAVIPAARPETATGTLGIADPLARPGPGGTR